MERQIYTKDIENNRYIYFSQHKRNCGFTVKNNEYIQRYPLTDNTRERIDLVLKYYTSMGCRYYQLQYKGKEINNSDDASSLPYLSYLYRMSNEGLKHLYTEKEITFGEFMNIPALKVLHKFVPERTLQDKLNVIDTGVIYRPVPDEDDTYILLLIEDNEAITKNRLHSIKIGPTVSKRYRKHSYVANLYRKVITGVHKSKTSDEINTLIEYMEQNTTTVNAEEIVKILQDGIE